MWLAQQFDTSSTFRLQGLIAAAGVWNRVLRAEEIKVRRRLAAYHQERARTLKSASAREIDIRAAIVHLDAVIKMLPNSGKDYYRRGACYRLVSQHAKARGDFTMFRRLKSVK